MNKHGQTLVLFVILIPLVLLLCGVIVDTGLVIHEKVQLKEVSKTVIKESLENNYSEEKIKKIFKKNDVDINNLNIDINDNKITIKNEINVNSLFGSIIGIKDYKIKIDISGSYKNNKVIYE